MAGYANVLSRADVGEALVPNQTVTEILQEAPKSSVVLDRAKKVRMSAKKATQPVLSSLPDAYWVEGDTGLKETTKNMWSSLSITAEELAVIVPIPDALIDDANVPLWEEIKPLLAEAIGRAVDRAALFGVDKPASWPAGIIPAAIAKGNVVPEGTTADLGADVAMLGKTLAQQGSNLSAFATEPGLQWELIGLRNEGGTPIYTPSLSDGAPSGLYGKPLNEVDNGAWDSDVAKILGVDWSKFVVGIRQDITFKLFSEGVLTDTNGKVLLNLMQQDSKALRVVFRVGFQVANPLSRVGGTTGYPAGVITPKGE